MEAKKNKRDRSNSGSSHLGVSIIAFLLGFIFAFIVLIGSVLGVGIVAATTDINEVFRVFGLENVKENPENENDKYNYINADQAGNIYQLVLEIIKMADDGLGEISLNRIDALAPVTSTVLDLAYKYIDDVVDLDKEYFENAPLTSVFDCITKSMYYVRTTKVVDLLNNDMGYSIDLEGNYIMNPIVNGVEANYATITVDGNVVMKDSDPVKLPVLFDYYVYNETSTGPVYSRSIEFNGEGNALPDNIANNAEKFLYKTSTENKFKVFYVPCKLTANGIEQATYIPTTVDCTDSDPNSKITLADGSTHELTYRFKSIEYDEDTVFIAVEPKYESGELLFNLDYNEIVANGDMYYYLDSYARNYHGEATKTDSNDSLYGVSTINGINYFKDVDGNVIEYDPLTVSDIMLDPTRPLYESPVYSIVNSDNADVVHGIFGETSLGAILDPNFDYNGLIQNIQLSAILTDVSVDDSVMTNIVYSISNVKQGEDGSYTAIYEKDGVKKKVDVEVKINVKNETVIKSVIDPETNEKLEGNRVSDLNNITNNMTVGVFLDVKVDDAIMTYLGYGVTDVEKIGENKYSGQYEETEDNLVDVYIYTDEDGIVEKIVYAEDEDSGAIEIREVKGTTINQIGDRVDNVTNILTVPDIIDIDPENALMSYIGYGVYDLEAAEPGSDYAYTGTYKQDENEITVYIYTEEKDGNTIISSVRKDADTRIKGTKIDEISTLMDDIDKAIAITEFIDIDADDGIMTYLGYGVYDAEAESGDGYTHVGLYDVEGLPTKVYIATEPNAEGKAIITSVWYVEGPDVIKVKGTKISEVSDRMDGINDKISITEFMDVKADDAIMMYISYGVYEVAEADPNPGVDSLGNEYSYKGTYEVEVDGVLTAYECYLTVDEDKNITDIWYIAGGERQTITGTKIGAVPDRVNTLKDKLTIGEIIEVTDESSMILQAIADTKISDLDDRINKLTVSDVLSDEQINNNSVLPHLRDALVVNLGDAIDEVLIQDIYLDNVYKDLDDDGVIELLEVGTDIDFDPAYLYYEYKNVGTEEEPNYKYVLVNPNGYSKDDPQYDNALGKLSQDDWNNRDAGKMYYTYGEAKGMWRLVLYRIDAHGNKTEKAYTLNNFNSMVNECTKTVYNSTLYELKDAGVITGIEDTELAIKLKTVNTDNPVDAVSGNVNYKYVTVDEGSGEILLTEDIDQGKQLGDLTLQQLLKALTTFFA